MSFFLPLFPSWRPNHLEEHLHRERSSLLQQKLRWGEKIGSSPTARRVSETETSFSIIWGIIVCCDIFVGHKYMCVRFMRHFLSSPVLNPFKIVAPCLFCNFQQTSIKNSFWIEKVEIRNSEVYIPLLYNSILFFLINIWTNVRVSAFVQGKPQSANTLKLSAINFSI